MYFLILVSTLQSNTYNTISDLPKLNEQQAKIIEKKVEKHDSRQSQLITSSRENTNSAMKNSEGKTINNGYHRNGRKILNKTAIENYKASTRVLSPDLNLDYIEFKKEKPKQSLNLFETLTKKKRELVRQSIKNKLMNYASLSIPKENNHIRKDANSELSRYNKFNLHSPNNCITVIKTCFRKRNVQSKCKNKQNEIRNISPCDNLNNHGTQIIDDFLHASIRRPASKTNGKINKKTNNTFYNSLIGISNEKTDPSQKIKIRPSSRANNIVIKGKY